METLLLWIGRLAGLAGIALCTFAVLVRLAGLWHLGTFQVGTLLEVGMAGMLLACLAYLSTLAEGAALRRRPGSA